jgi:SUZ domain
MPALIISPSATSSRSVLSPPPGAFQPTMRILKRPSDSTSPTPPPSSSTSEPIKAREARYQAARDRIFGEENGPNNSSSQLARKSPASAQDNPIVSIVRNPRGPGDYTADDETVRDPTRGFGGRRAKLSPAASEDFNGIVQEAPT